MNAPPAPATTALPAAALAPPAATTWSVPTPAQPWRVMFLKEGRELVGAEVATLRLLRHLPPTHATVHLLVVEYRAEASPFLLAARALGDAVHLHEHRYRGPLALARAVRALARQSRCEVLCSVGYKMDLLGFPAVAGLGVACLSVLHGWVGNTARLRFYRWLDRWCLRYGAGVLTVSRPLEREALALSRSGRVACLFNGVDVPALQRAAAAPPAVTWPTDLPTVLYAGRLSPEKGLLDLLDAATRQTASARLVLAGDGPLATTLPASTAAAQLGARLLLAGQQSNVHPLFRQATVLVLPSHTEGLPLVLLEAMALGLPIVATRVGGIPDLLTHEETALLVPAHDPAALAAALDRLLGDAALRQRLAANAARVVAREYTEPQVAERLLASLARWWPRST